jgi:hypothetical protein
MGERLSDPARRILEPEAVRPDIRGPVGMGMTLRLVRALPERYAGAGEDEECLLEPVHEEDESDYCENEHPDEHPRYEAMAALAEGMAWHRPRTFDDMGERTGEVGEVWMTLPFDPEETEAVEPSESYGEQPDLFQVRIRDYRYAVPYAYWGADISIPPFIWKKISPFLPVALVPRLRESRLLRGFEGHSEKIRMLAPDVRRHSVDVVDGFGMHEPGAVFLDPGKPVEVLHEVLPDF